MDEDDIVKKIVTAWNDQIVVPPVEAFIKKRHSLQWVVISVAASIVFVMIVISLKYARPDSPTFSEWEASTDFLLNTNNNETGF